MQLPDVVAYLFDNGQELLTSRQRASEYWLRGYVWKLRQIALAVDFPTDTESLGEWAKAG